MKSYKNIIGIGIGILVFGVSVFLISKIIVLQKQFEKATGLSLKTTWNLIVNGGAEFEKRDGRTNILLLGMSGGDNAGSDLTDTIIVASVDTIRPSTTLISIPRDIWSEDLKDKVNSAYHYGEEKETGGGFALSKSTISSVVGMPIHYAMSFDFSGFTKLIDLVGGIDVDVTKPFTDTNYPIAGKENDLCDGDYLYRCRYETIVFEKGFVHMDGTLALKYVRSRYAKGDEGTDFARSQRQQDVIIALKNEILKEKPWFHPTLAIQLIKAVDEASQMDISIAQLLSIGKLFLNKEPVINKVSIEPFLEVGSSYIYDRYVLVPTIDFPTIHGFIKKELMK